jgi:hypothetical protein
LRAAIAFATVTGVSGSRSGFVGCTAVVGVGCPSPPRMVSCSVVVSRIDGIFSLIGASKVTRARVEVSLRGAACGGLLLSAVFVGVNCTTGGRASHAGSRGGELRLLAAPLGSRESVRDFRQLG